MLNRSLKFIMSALHAGIKEVRIECPIDKNTDFYRSLAREINDIYRSRKFTVEFDVVRHSQTISNIHFTLALNQQWNFVSLAFFQKQNFRCGFILIFSWYYKEIHVGIYFFVFFRNLFFLHILVIFIKSGINVWFGFHTDSGQILNVFKIIMFADSLNKLILPLQLLQREKFVMSSGKWDRKFQGKEKRRIKKRCCKVLFFAFLFFFCTFFFRLDYEPRLWIVYHRSWYKTHRFFLWIISHGSNILNYTKRYYFQDGKYSLFLSVQFPEKKEVQTKSY